MKTQILVDEVWVDGAPEVGEWYRKEVAQEVWQEERHVLAVEDRADTERKWRDSELLRTDALIVLPDYPIDLTSYRVALRAYPEQLDFPTGGRPIL